MKKLTRTVICAALALSLLIPSLVACSSEATFKSAIDDMYNTKWKDENKTLISHSNLGEIGTLKDSTDVLGVFTFINNDGKKATKIFNFESALSVTTLVDDDVENLVYLNSSFEDIYALVTVEDREYTLAFYDSNGAVIYEYDTFPLSTSYLSPYTENDIWELVSRFGDELIAIENKLYSRNEEGNYTQSSSYQFKNLPEITSYTDDRYYMVDDDEFAIYDKSFNLIVEYTTPSYASNSSIFMLENGNILLQYRIKLLDDSEKYDFLSNNVKYDLVTLLVDKKDGKMVELDANYLIDLVVSANLFEEIYGEGYLAKSVQNLASIVEIDQSKRLDTNNNERLVLMANDGKIKSDLIVDGYTDVPQMVDGDRYIFRDKNDNQILVNRKGAHLATISDDYTFICNYNYFYDDRAIYDLDGNVMYELEANNAKVDSSFGDIAFITSESNGTIPARACKFSAGTVDIITSYGIDGDVDEFGLTPYYYYTAKNTANGIELKIFTHDGAQFATLSDHISNTIYADDYIIIVDSSGTVHKLVLGTPEK